MKLAVGEALQCPTILNNGFGDHRIEGIGDKHIPWIHNVKNTDMVIDIDDEDSQRLLRLFNDPAGLQYLKEEAGVDGETLSKLSWLGISGIANVLCCIKMAKYYELTGAGRGGHRPHRLGRHVRLPHPGAGGPVRPLRRRRPPRWTTAFICWACAPTPWRS